MTTMGVYVRDLLLGQYYFDTLFPRIPVPVMRQIVSNLEKMKLPTKTSGSTGENSRHGSDDTARRPPSVKAALSVSFGQRAPHRASTRDSSPVRRTLAPPSYDRDDSRRSPRARRSQSRDLSDRDYQDRDSYRDRDYERDRDRRRDSGRDREHDRDKDRRRDYDIERDYERDRDRRRDYDRGRNSERDGERDSRRHNRRSRSRSRSLSLQAHGEVSNHHHGSQRNDNNEKAAISSNLAKLKDMYGDLSDEKGDAGAERRYNKDSGAEEVIRLGGSSWR